MSIAYIDYYVPTEELTIAEFVNQLDKDRIPKAFVSSFEYLEFINEILGLKSIRVENNLEAEEMIGKVLDKAIQSNQLDPSKIDMIVYVPDNHSYRIENIAKYIQFKYEMHNASVMQITGNDCVNIEMAVSFCSDLLKANNQLKNILIISVTKTDTIGDRVVGTYGVYGDAAGIILMSSDSSQIVLRDIVSICIGEFYKADLDAVHVLRHCQYTLKCLNRLIDRNKLKNNVDAIIIQNANTLLVKQCLHSKGFSEDIIFKNNISKYGHLNQLDFLVNLKDLVMSKKEQKNKSVISFGSGWAGSYVSTLMTF